MTRWVLISAIITLTVLAGSWWIYTARYDSLPAQIPVYFDYRLRPDAWVPKEDYFRTVLVIPAVMVGIILLGLALPWLSPRPFDVDRFRNTYGYVMTLAVALVGYMQLAFLWLSLRPPAADDVARVFLAGMFLFFALIGNVLGKVRRNFWIGVRTPWTLASEAVWIRTHRLSAWLFVAVGLAGLVATLAGVPTLWCLIGLGIIVIVPVAYSAIVYRRIEQPRTA